MSILFLEKRKSGLFLWKSCFYKIKERGGCLQIINNNHLSRAKFISVKCLVCCNSVDKICRSSIIFLLTDICSSLNYRLSQKTPPCFNQFQKHGGVFWDTLYFREEQISPCRSFRVLLNLNKKINFPEIHQILNRFWQWTQSAFNTMISQRLIIYLCFLYIYIYIYIYILPCNIGHESNYAKSTGYSSWGHSLFSWFCIRYFYLAWHQKVQFFHYGIKLLKVSQVPL